MGSFIKAVQNRLSIRSYTDQHVSEEIKGEMKAFMETNCTGPFGNHVRFQLLEGGENVTQELKELGAYGAIRGAALFIAGAVKKNKKAMEDFGYCMEKVILKATELGLGTCWLGGSLNRSTFGEKINIVPDEIIPAVTPLGYPADKRRFVETMLRGFVGSATRKDFEKLFFGGDINMPLKKAECGKYGEALECVRLAPSASNMQPWRVIKEKERDVFHFYLKENRFYNSIIKEIKIQNLDLGIAMCHFEAAASELELKGAWSQAKPSMDAGDWQYIASWIG